MEASTREQLLAADPEFRRLAEEHTQREQRLQELLSVPFPNTDQQIEEMRLKKEKLRLRDQMETFSRAGARVQHAV